MRALLRATALLSGSSVIRIGIGLVTAKVWAVLVGPPGVGFYGLLQSLLSFSAIVVGAGIGTGVVRLGADALGRNDVHRAAALQTAALRISWGAGTIGALVILLFGQQLGVWIPGAAQTPASAALIGMAIWFTVVTETQTGILNAHHRVAALAQSTVIGGAVGASLNIGILWVFRDGGMVPAMLATTAGGWLATFWYVRRSIGPHSSHNHSRDDLRSAARALLAFGIPYVASRLVGSGAALAVPWLVLRTLGVESVGYYRASASISVGYVGFVLVAMSQDYYPRLAGANSDPAELSRLINQQLRFLFLVGSPIVLIAQATAQFAVPILYSPVFRPAVSVLTWQLFGNLFMFLSWVFSFVVLARSTSRAYFAAEAVGGVTLLAATWVAIEALGLVGAGIGYMAAFVIYAVVVSLFVRRTMAFSLSPENRSLVLLVLTAGALIQVLSYATSNRWATPVSLVLASGIAIVNALRLYREVIAAPNGSSFIPAPRVERNS